MQSRSERCRPLCRNASTQLIRIRRRQKERRDRIAFDLADEVVDQQARPGRQDERSACHQRHQPSFVGNIEIDRSRLEFAVARVHAVQPADRLAMHGERTVRDRHALRRSGRARCVDHVGQAVRVDLDIEIARVVADAPTAAARPGARPRSRSRAAPARNAGAARFASTPASPHCRAACGRGARLDSPDRAEDKRRRLSGPPAARPSCPGPAPAPDQPGDPDQCPSDEDVAPAGSPGRSTRRS